MIVEDEEFAQQDDEVSENWQKSITIDCIILAVVHRSWRERLACTWLLTFFFLFSHIHRLAQGFSSDQRQKSSIVWTNVFIQFFNSILLFNYILELQFDRNERIKDETNWFGNFDYLISLNQENFMRFKLSVQILGWTVKLFS